MEIKGLNQTKKCKSLAIESTELSNTIKLLCPIILDDDELPALIDDFVLKKMINEVELQKRILEKYDYLLLETLETLCIALDGYKIIIEEHDITTAKQLDDYFNYQKTQFLVSKKGNNMTLHSLNKYD